MITNKHILTEVEQLSRLFKDGEADIPSMWNCFWPGLAAMFWLLLWPIAMFSYKLFFVELPNAAQMGIAASVLVAFVAGLFMMLYIVNFRALYLSIPDTYRKQSALCQFIVGKAKFYCRVYLLTYVFLIISCTYPVYGAIYSTVLFICFSFCLMQIVNVDLSRYQLTALTSLLETFKTSKSEK